MRIPTSSSSPPNQDLHPGYRLLGLRGRGSFGEVWTAQSEDGRRVALKFLPYARGRGAGLELRSYQTVRDLQHPNLIRLDKAWCASYFLIIAMELADGSLADLLETYLGEVGKPLWPDHLLPLLAQAAQALDFLNGRRHFVNGDWVSVQHCDVTVRNLLIVGETVKLSDFGLTTTLTTEQKVHRRAGTPAYCAPEVFQGRLSDRTDQYALAVCYCVLRGGQVPFRDTPPNFQAEYARPAPDLSMLSAEERPAIARALATNPRDRWPSCGELIAELERSTGVSNAVEVMPQLT
jgi:serine/threonine protein kinase, bacterial